MSTHTADREENGLDEVENELIAHRNRVRVLEADIAKLRLLLFLRHSNGDCLLYGDDGELQCNSCCIDFKRSEVAEIEKRFTEIGLARLAKQLGVIP